MVGVQGPAWDAVDQVLPSIVVDSSRCTGCGLCIPFCKPDVIRVGSLINALGDRQMEVFRDGCTGCEMCAVMCPDVAIGVYSDRPRGRSSARRES